MHAPEVPNLITLLWLSPLKDREDVHLLHAFEGEIFSLVIVLLISFFVVIFVRKLEIIPGRVQNFVELMVEKAREFVCGILGTERGDRYLPFLGSLFLFIFFNNLLGLVPFFKSPTSSFKTPLALGILSFFYVQYTALRENGFLKYMYHLAGEPQNYISWLLSPLMLVLHIIGEVSKPFSLALRLFGNIFGEDILLGTFVLLGISLFAYLGFKLPFGAPLQFPFYFLALITSFIQALVFSILTTVYILLVLPHEEH
jgi:F-type H+-transporting ATPase subunit a